MVDTDDAGELLFFDTFSHEVDSDINLDLVQFPKPVYITSVRIIPLGARVQADFPGGVRLGATNPSKFDIEFYVNDLGMPGASTFENLGHLEYNQNDRIHLECSHGKIPTDGLVLRGWYSTITLAVYGVLTNAVSEPIASPPSQPCEPIVQEEISLGSNGRLGMHDDRIKEGWKEPIHSGELTHAHKSSISDYERERDLDRDRDRRIRKASHSSERSASSRNHTHSESNEREYIRTQRPHEHDRERDRDRDRDRERERERERDRDRERDREREREQIRERRDSRDWSRSPEYRRHAKRKRSERSRSDIDDQLSSQIWPRSPPCIDSPSRPHSPENMQYVDDDVIYNPPSKHAYLRASEESLGNMPPLQQQPSHIPHTSTSAQLIPDAALTVDVEDEIEQHIEQFEPILSDDEIIAEEIELTAAEAEQVMPEEFEIEIEAEAAIPEPAIIEFDAFKMPISKFEGDLHAQYSKELETLKVIFKKFELQTKCSTMEEFKESTTTIEERENFVYLSEQLITHLLYLSQQYKVRNFVLQQFFKSDDEIYMLRAYVILQIALDFEAACLQPQPAFKIRHIKVGARLAELLGASAEFFDFLTLQQFDPFAALFKLYKEEYMAMSIKLLLLKAVYALLDTKPGLRHFISAKLNGYELILETLQKSHLTRTKYALQAIIKKLNLNEALECIKQNCTNLFVLSNYCPPDPATPYQLIEQAIDQLLDALDLNKLSYQQPKRFLPVSKKFEIVSDVVAQRSFSNALQAYFVQHSLSESLLLLLSNASDLPAMLLKRCLDLLQALLPTHFGVDYFVDDCFETTQMLVAILLGIGEVPIEKTETNDETVKKEEPKDEATTSKSANVTSNSADESNRIARSIEEMLAENDSDKAKASADEAEKTIAAAQLIAEESAGHGRKPLMHRLQRLGVELAFKCQTRFHLDSILYTATSNEYDSEKLASHLHALYSQTCNASGRQHTVDVIALNNNLQIFMDLIKKEQTMLKQRQLSTPGAKHKSPVLSYAVDLVDCCVRYCENLDYLILHGSEILDLAKNHDTFEPSVSAVLQEMFVYLKPLEVPNIFSSDNIAPLIEVITRSLEYITTFPGDLIMGLRILRHLSIGSKMGGSSSGETVELKHRFVGLQFYAADGVQMLLQILEKLCSYFEQPGLHTPALATMQGVHCCQIVLTTLQILREMISCGVQCRDVEFKDLTAIDHLMKTYYLMYYFPQSSQAALDAEKAMKEIIQILLAYTQPNEQEDEDSLHKSLWTQMIREALKNIDAPQSFIPGLQVLSELLPLPFPIPVPSSTVIDEDETQSLITKRKLWSAHLHPQGTQISKLIETLVPTCAPTLMDRLTGVCLQLADLAPNMTLLVSKTVVDMLLGEWTVCGGVPTPLLSRLLHFFGRITAFASIKSSALSILSGKLWDLFQTVLFMTEPSEVALRCQVSLHRIVENFLDADISLIAPQSTATPELNLASALPPRELIPRIVEATLVNLMNSDATNEVSALGIRNLVIMTEHNITFFHLATLLKKMNHEFQQWIQKVVALVLETGSYNSNIESLVVLLRSLTQIEDISNLDLTIPPRTLKLTTSELSEIICYDKDGTPQLLHRIRVILEQNREDTFLADINKLIAQLESPDSGDADEESALLNEPFLPQTESIVTQYESRPIFAAYDPASATAEDEALTQRYWTSEPPVDPLSNEDFDTNYERVPRDLHDLASGCLPPETNLTGECKRNLHLSASPHSTRERTPTAPCFRTRRVEVEPTTGRPEKKIYITQGRGRGYSRPPVSRGDLFRSRPPNTSRPPSLHVDDFLALETCGAQPTGPTGYNKIPPIMRGGRVGRSRGSRIATIAAYRKPKMMHGHPSGGWNEGPQHYRPMNPEPHYGGEMHYIPHYRGRGRGRPRPYMGR